MALRVLLADESSTIKKVMQLALQDFQVEVKAVPIGLDVLDVAKSFQPEIIFADVLLAKKNGYEVCAQLKADATLHKVPVVLMWSGFMEIDERKAALSKPDRRLEKPFDAEMLRNLVRDLVPRLQQNAISQYLTFPNLPEIEEDARAKKYAERQKAKRAEAPPQMEDPEPELTIPVFEDQEDEEDFQNVPLPRIPEQQTPARTAQGGKKQDSGANPQDPSDNWSHQDLSQFKIEVNEEDLTREYELSAQDLSRSSIAITSGLEEISLEDMDLSAPMVPEKIAAEKPVAEKRPAAKAPTQAAQPKTQQPVRQDTLSRAGQIQGGETNPFLKTGTNPQIQSSLPSMTQLSHERVEQILREQVREVLENIAWKIIPDIAERIVREEVQKLMKDAERI